MRCASPEQKKAKRSVSHYVQIRQMQFLPADLTVNAGDTVVFQNNDMVAHDVTEESRKAWASGVMQPGARWKMPVAEDVNYYCSIHVVMKGKIKVVK